MEGQKKIPQAAIEAMRRNCTDFLPKIKRQGRCYYVPLKLSASLADTFNIGVPIS